MRLLFWMISILATTVVSVPLDHSIHHQHQLSEQQQIISSSLRIHSRVISSSSTSSISTSTSTYTKPLNSQDKLQSVTQLTEQIKKLGITIKPPTFIEIENNEQLNNQMMGSGPPKILTTTIKSLIDAREEIRKASDPATINGFKYTVESKEGRVETATGYVRLKSRGSIGVLGHEICNAMWYHSNGKASRVGKDWHSGHVIASALGGDDKDPLNFFPQHAYSNSGNGVWWRMEIIAGHTKAMLEANAATSTCDLMITPVLEYDTSMWTWMPKGGYYYVEINKACGDAFAKFKIVANQYNWGAAVFQARILDGAHDVTDVFDTPKNTGYRLGWTWQNAFDQADRTIDALLYA